MKQHNSQDCQSDVDMSFKNNIWNAQLDQKQIVINGDITEDLIERAVLQIQNFNAIDNGDRLSAEERQPIVIFINTFGGVLHEAFSLVSAIESSVTPVITVALGKACSSGFLILLAGHQRFAQKYSTLMYHQGAGGVYGEFNKMIEYVDYVKQFQLRIEDYVISKTKIKKKKMEEVFSHKQDWFINTDEAITLGIVDSVWIG